MSRIGSEVWARLEQARPIGEQLAARPGAPELTDRLLCAVDSNGQRHLLVALQAQDEELNDVRSRGLSVMTRELVIQSREPAKYLDLECCDPAGDAALDLIGDELSRELAHAAVQPAEITRRVLAKWRRFWGQAPQAVLSREQQVGLFGELWFLNAWLPTRVTLGEAVGRWRGPFGARHDFEWPGKSVEVKVITSNRARIHVINGIDQLLPPESGSLFLFSLRVREEGGASNSLPLLVDHIQQQLQSDDEALSRFETALFQVGYSPLHEHEYARLVLRVVDEYLFSVTDGFPRIIPASFHAGVPPAIERIEYEVNVSNQDSFCVARNPTDAVDHLY